MIVYKKVFFIDGTWVRLWDRNNYCYEMFLPQVGYEVNHKLGLIYHTTTYEIKCERKIGRVRLWCKSLPKYASNGLFVQIEVI